MPIGERTPALLPTLIADLKAAVAYLQKHPDTKPSGTAAVYGAAASIPDEILQVRDLPRISPFSVISPASPDLSTARPSLSSHGPRCDLRPSMTFGFAELP